MFNLKWLKRHKRRHCHSLKPLMALNLIPAQERILLRANVLLWSRATLPWGICMRFMIWFGMLGMETGPSERKQESSHFNPLLKRMKRIPLLGVFLYALGGRMACPGPMALGWDMGLTCWGPAAPTMPGCLGIRERLFSSSSFWIL